MLLFNCRKGQIISLKSAPMECTFIKKYSESGWKIPDRCHACMSTQLDAGIYRGVLKVSGDRICGVKCLVPTKLRRLYFDDVPAFFFSLWYFSEDGFYLYYGLCNHIGS